MPYWNEYPPEVEIQPDSFAEPFGLVRWIAVSATEEPLMLTSEDIHSVPAKPQLNALPAAQPAGRLGPLNSKSLARLV